MGMDTHGKLKGKILAEEVLNFIKQKYDSNAKSHITLYDSSIEQNRIKKMYDNSNKYKVWNGFISFNDGQDDRSLFYSYSNVNTYGDLEYYSSLGLSEMVTSETTYISLGYNEKAIEIIKAIVTEFGGWIDENDCDDEPYYPIIKNPDGTIKPVIRVTMQDIYEKFGGTVVITDLQE